MGISLTSGGGRVMSGSEILSKIADGSLPAERMEFGDLKTIGTKLGFDITDDMNKE